MGQVTSDNYATKEHKLIFDSWFCLEVTIFSKSLKLSQWQTRSAVLSKRKVLKQVFQFYGEAIHE